MAAFQVEQAVCHGRDFTAPSGPVLGGLLYYLKVFAPKAILSGGMGWYIHDDQSALGTNPYIVISTHNAAGPNVPAKYVQILLPSATAAQIRVYYWIYWDPATQIGRGLYGAHDITTDDSVDFIYDFRGGPECFFIMTFTTAGVWRGSWIDEITMDPNLIDSVSATTASTNFTDNGNFQFRGFDLLGGSAANMVDSSGNVHFQIEFVSGVTWRVNAYNNTARGAGDLIWRSSNFTGLAALALGSTLTGTVQNSSGVTLGVYLQGGSAGTAADNAIVFKYNKIQVGSGEGAQFIVDNYYVIYDQTTRNAVNFFKVVSKATDDLTIDRLYRPFPAGAKISSYAHPFYVAGTGTTLWSNQAGIPYYNVAGTMSRYNASSSGVCEQNALQVATLGAIWAGGGTALGPNAVVSVEDNYIARMSPDRKGRYAVQRPGVIERTAFAELDSLASANTGYGQLKNVIMGIQGTMSPNLHGRTLSGIDYTYFRLFSAWCRAGQGYATMFRETESTS